MPLPDKIEVTRNNTVVAFVPTAFKRGKKAEAGEMYPAPAPTITLQDIIAHWGEDNAKNELLARWNLRTQAWYESATTRYDDAAKTKDNPDGAVEKPFDEAEFVKYASEFSARGLSKDEIQEAIKAGTDELLALLIDTTVSAEEKTQRATVLTQRIQGLNVDLAARRKPKQPEVVAE